jgi:hypothetical protein
MSTDPGDDIVRLVTAPNPAQAHLWEQALRDAGIRCKAVGGYLGGGIGDIPGMQAEVWVHRDDVARAEEVLRPFREAVGPGEVGEETEEAD